MAYLNLEQRFESLTPALLFKWLAWILAFAIVIVGIVFIFYFSEFKDGFSSNRADWGTFGDFIGGTLNPLLSFLGLIALLLTIVLQSKELESTRKELMRSALAQEKTETVLNEQSKTQIKQQFEGTFFSLLDQHNKALEKISVSTEKWTAGRSDIDIVREAVFGKSVSSLAEAKNALEQKNGLCGHYFRVLFQILKFVATNVPDSHIGVNFNEGAIKGCGLVRNEKMYSNILRSFLGYDVTQLLAIYCYCAGPQDTYWNFKLLMERYAFLEHMPFEIEGENNKLLLSVVQFYDETAFGQSQFKSSFDSR
ncbi:putative phage abortive infection protein [Pseudomonas sp. AU10]|uniref:putative phage abortive infection protein n=1 Tax=Pseudomonas sp. AU10 TaxID=882697 RepID=UPI0021E1C9DD|nr:putative phage abortive infection protein [Pseudomonas sp. AU10]MCV2228298.1 putative phage abortive infection protein [Pseudomonas sp. AU10]